MQRASVHRERNDSVVIFSQTVIARQEVVSVYAFFKDFSASA